MRRGLYVHAKKVTSTARLYIENKRVSWMICPQLDSYKFEAERTHDKFRMVWDAEMHRTSVCVCVCVFSPL